MTGQNGTTPQRAQVPPRGHENAGGDPTAPPTRARFAPSGTTPEPPDPERSPIEQHWRKHPSDYHADNATGALISSMTEADSAKRAELLAAAQINATLSLRDAVLEHAAVMRDIRDGKSKRSDTTS